MDTVLTMTDAEDAALTEAISANFLAHATLSDVPSDFRPLTIRVERDGVLLGGMNARTLRRWLYVDNLALPLAEAGAGLGRKLMAAAEAEAVRRGCVGAFLQTVAFQAPGFYRKLGYTEFARLPHDDPRLTRIWFRKRLGP